MSEAQKDGTVRHDEGITVTDDNIARFVPNSSKGRSYASNSQNANDTAPNGGNPDNGNKSSNGDAPIPSLNDVAALTEMTLDKYESSVSQTIDERLARLDETRSKMSQRTRENQRASGNAIAVRVSKVSSVFAKRRTFLQGNTVFHRIFNRVANNAELMAKRYAPVDDIINETLVRINSAIGETEQDSEAALELRQIHEACVIELTGVREDTIIRHQEVQEEVRESTKALKDLTEGTLEYQEALHLNRSQKRVLIKLDRLIDTLDSKVLKAQNNADAMYDIQDSISTQSQKLADARGQMYSARLNIEGMKLAKSSKERLLLSKSITEMSDRSERMAAKTHSALKIQTAREAERSEISTDTLKHLANTRKITDNKVSAIMTKGAKDRVTRTGIREKMRADGIGDSVSIESRRLIALQAQKRREERALIAQGNVSEETTPE